MVVLFLSIYVIVKVWYKWFLIPIKRHFLVQQEKLRNEYVIQVSGKVLLRPEDMINAELPSGKIEIEAQDLVIFSQAQTPPFQVDEYQAVGEEARLRHRYVDLRRPEMFGNLAFRAKGNGAIREYLDQQAFIEVETPFLTKATPEGARDYLVPSRVHKGAFYALPQSPQLFKQLLMMSGFGSLLSNCALFP